MMTLIQIMICYRGMVAHRGRDYANHWLDTAIEHNMLPSNIKYVSEEIKNSVDDKGYFIDDGGRHYYVKVY